MVTSVPMHQNYEWAHSNVYPNTKNMGENIKLEVCERDKMDFISIYKFYRIGLDGA